MALTSWVFFFFFNDTATTEIYTLSLHDALPISYQAFPSISICASTWPLARSRGCRPRLATHRSLGTPPRGDSGCPEPGPARSGIGPARHQAKMTQSPLLARSGSYVVAGGGRRDRSYT